MDPLESSPDRRSSAALPALELRPLSTGELLDRVFFLYRSRAMQFWALSLVTAVITVFNAAAQMVLQHSHLVPAHGRAGSLLFLSSPGAAVLYLITYLLAIAGYAVVQGAATRLVSQLYLGRRGNAGEALREALPHTLRYIGIELWKVWSAIWVPAVLGVAAAFFFSRHEPGTGGFFILLAFLAFIYGAIAYIRNSLAIPGSVVEQLGVRASMRRSKLLVAGRKWRIFLLFLLLMVLYIVALAIQSPVLIFLAHAKTPTQIVDVAFAIQLAITFVITLVLTPIASIALCLFYFDERIRREGFDIDFLLRGPEAALPVPPVYPGPGLDPGLASGLDAQTGASPVEPA